MANHPVVRIVLVFLMAWGIFSLLLKMGGAFLIFLIAILIAVIAVLISLLKHQPQKLAPYYRYPVAKWFIDIVCQLGSYQAPIAEDSKKEDSAGELLLVDPVDFSRAAQRLKKIISGHDDHIDRILDQLRASIILRTTSVSPVSSPLGVFLLAGPSGIGKRFLARKLSALLFRRPSVCEINMNNYPDDASALSSLIGTDGKAGRIVKAVKDKPYHAILIENCDATPPRMQQALVALLSNGMLLDPSSQAPVDFRHCLFFLITTTAYNSLVACDGLTNTRRERKAKYHQALAENTPLEQTLLAQVHDTLLFHPLGPMKRAEVIFLLMQRECRKYNIVLDYVDAELLADETLATGGADGFALSPARVGNLLRDPLVRAANSQQARLSLRSNEITMLRQPEISQL